MWNKDEEAPSPQSAQSSAPSRKQTRIGSSVSLSGTLKAEEDLFLEGRLDGEIVVPKHQVTVGKNGRVKADLHARVIQIEGRVVGDLIGGETVVVAASGQVEGNIKAPRVSLDNGAQFRGSIDMDPASGQGESKPTPPAHKELKPAEPTRASVEAAGAVPKPGASAANS